MSINQIQDEIIEEFELLDDWIDRYQLLVDYGMALKKQPEWLPEAEQTKQNLIDGCQSQVWFTAKTATDEQGRQIIVYRGASDAILVKGIVALLLRVLSGHTAKEIVDADLYFIDRVGLREHLSPTRSNGIAAMLKQMKLYALALPSSSSSSEV
jgi:cysteine desulfuration protein SufE